jgi:acetyl esterase
VTGDQGQRDASWWKKALTAFSTDMFEDGAFDSVALRRAAIRHLHQAVEKSGPLMAQTEEIFIALDHSRLPARLYTPFAAGIMPAPVILFFHGGGFSTCSVETHDGLCRRLGAASRARVLSVEYRLAPEHPFPAAYDDALASYRWLFTDAARAVGLSPGKVVVAGDSAGGNLAINIALADRPDLPAPAMVVLLYPWLQLVDSYRNQMRLEEGHGIAVAIIEAARKPYLNGQDPNDPRISPLFHERLESLPPSLVVTAELDPLANEARALVARLQAQGRRVQHWPVAPSFHGFMTSARVNPMAEPTARRVGEAIALELAA